MPSYQYEAVDATGRSDRGMIDADSERSARHALRARGLLPLAVRETRKRPDRGGYAVARISDADLGRSGESRGGKGGVRYGRDRWAPVHSKNKTKQRTTQ